jgi:glycosyltransferase involved in cell wall biosynthesis
MKIVIPVLSVGPSGGYRVISELSSAWVRMGHSVYILAQWTGAYPYFPTLAEFIWLNEHGHRINPEKGKSVLIQSGIKHVFQNLLALWTGLRREVETADVILANHSLTSYPVFATRSCSKKYYYIQAYEPETVKKRVKWISYFSYSLPLRQIVNSPVYIGYKNIKAKEYVPPGLDLSKMYPKNRRFAPDGKILIGCIGSKAWFKGVDNTLDAFAILQSRKKNLFEFRIAYGLFPEGHSLLPEIVTVMPQDDEELGDFYRSIDILIAPGKLQLGSAHYPVMEAMACGTVVITTGYLPASKESNNAWIVPVNDPTAIADAVEEIVDKPILREQRIKKALGDIQDYAWGNVADKMIALFNERQASL